jgi:hypothetical protein
VAEKPLPARHVRHRFPEPFYHQRWHIENGFNQYKQDLDSALAVRNTTSRNRELVLRVFTHNFMLLAEAARAFRQRNFGPVSGRGLNA